jgi:glycosyltransferase involved in cell wall biosynthesis
LYGNRKNEIIAKSKLLVLPSQDENFANVILESLLSGTAVVVSNKVGLSDFVKQFNLGWVIGDEDKIEDVLNDALLDTDKLNFINQNSRDIVLREFDDEKLKKMYFEMYNDITLK